MRRASDPKRSGDGPSRDDRVWDSCGSGDRAPPVGLATTPLWLLGWPLRGAAFDVGKAIVPPVMLVTAPLGLEPLGWPLREAAFDVGKPPVPAAAALATC